MRDRFVGTSPFGGAVFTDDVDKALAVARGFRTGTVGHNGMLVDYGIGFGGFKQSGVGREGGLQGLSAYLESKTIILAGEPGAAAGTSAPRPDANL